MMPPKPETRFAVRADDEFIAWVDETATATQRTRASLVAIALTEFATTHGLPAPPRRCAPRRTMADLVQANGG